MIVFKARLIKLMLVVAGGMGSFSASAQTRVSTDGEAPLTNSAIIKLVRAGFREKTLITIINSRPSRFELTPDRLIELKRSGVSEKIILAMLGRDLEGSVVMTDEDLEMSDDEFFGRGRAGSSSNPNDLNIFGSSGGSRNQTRTGGINGGSSGDTQSSGTASVRIIRPPVEAGSGGTPKLERTPTLTNDGVMELVEAGFSEGTIIRRIELSPVEFDFAPAKVAELRRRRVTEPVIAAMKSAMSDEAEAPRRTP